jgi:hypothetical protein
MLMNQLGLLNQLTQSTASYEFRIGAKDKNSLTTTKFET